MNQEQSLGNLFRRLAEDLSTLVRSEIALAKHELKEAATAMGLAGALFTGALFCALCGVVFLMVTLILVMALVMPAWLAALIIALLLFGCAVVLALIGKNKLKKTQFVPSATIDSVRTDVEAIRGELGRAQRRADVAAE